ncbi:MAG: hypothetical protein M3353_06120, partial [Actinomycetota bacterium]|nr:hypothetical protein [Actinomycetota bacterium]
MSARPGQAPPPPTWSQPTRTTPTAAAEGGGQTEPTNGPPEAPAGTNPGCLEHWRRRHRDLLAACGIASDDNWQAFVGQVHQLRRQAGQPLTRWSPAHLLAALELAVRSRGWPAEQTTTALRHVAADPATRSPARLAEAGPWWDPSPAGATNEPEDLSLLEAELESVGGLRVFLQRQARADLGETGMPITRA